MERGSEEEFDLDRSLALGDVSVLVRMFGGGRQSGFSVPSSVVELGVQAAARMDSRGTTNKRLNIVEMLLADTVAVEMRLGPEYNNQLLVDVALEQAVEPSIGFESPSVARVHHPDGRIVPSIYDGLSTEQTRQLEWDLVWENVPIIHALVSRGATLATGRTLERRAIGKFLWCVARRRFAMRSFLFFWFGLAVESKYANADEAARMADEWTRMLYHENVRH